MINFRHNDVAFSDFNLIKWLFFFSPHCLNTRSLHKVMAMGEGVWFLPIVPLYSNTRQSSVYLPSSGCCPISKASSGSLALSFPPSFSTVEISHVIPLLLWRQKSWGLDCSALSNHTILSFLLQLLSLGHDNGRTIWGFPSHGAPDRKWGTPHFLTKFLHY